MERTRLMEKDTHTTLQAVQAPYSTGAHSTRKEQTLSLTFVRWEWNWIWMTVRFKFTG